MLLGTDRTRTTKHAMRLALAVLAVAVMVAASEAMRLHVRADNAARGEMLVH